MIRPFINIEDLIEEPSLDSLLRQHGQALQGGQKSQIKKRVTDAKARLKILYKNYATQPLTKDSSQADKNNMYLIPNTQFFNSNITEVDQVLHDKVNPCKVIDPMFFYKKNFRNNQDFKEWFTEDIIREVTHKLNAIRNKYKLQNRDLKNKRDNQLKYSKSKSIILNQELRNNLTPIANFNIEKYQLQYSINKNRKNSIKQEYGRQNRSPRCFINDELKLKVWYLQKKNQTLDYICKNTTIKMNTVKTIIHRKKYSLFKPKTFSNQNAFKKLTNREIKILYLEFVREEKLGRVYILKIRDMITELFNKNIEINQIRSVLRFLRIKYKNNETSERKLHLDNKQNLLKHIQVIYLLTKYLKSTVNLQTVDESNFPIGDKPQKSQSRIGSRPHYPEVKNPKKLSYCCMTGEKKIELLQISDISFDQLTQYSFMVNADFTIKTKFPLNENLIIVDAHRIHKIFKIYNQLNRSGKTTVFLLGPNLSWLNCQEYVNHQQKHQQRQTKNENDLKAIKSFIDCSFDLNEEEIRGCWIQTFNRIQDYWNDVVRFYHEFQNDI